ncbi:hypothetical protein [Methylopila turkensis]|uniref:Uncharacterized protein n=1 Tax=Methylopila turkensis TaxID=1437816 RepID=A0A9W6JLP8_9HYPH|nr:hypothetical protein [Methylopila turkensis]GLK79487.1 hypothetical protein GCM10008174_12280 [Methylopila turkensis]
MKNIILSTALAAGLGALAFAPASAAPIGARGTIAVSPAVTDVACRTVEKRVTRNGMTRITRQQECTRDRDRYERRVYRDDRRRYVDRREYRRYDDRPGLNIRIGN